MANLEMKMTVRAEDRASQAVDKVTQAVKNSGRVTEQTARTNTNATQRVTQAVKESARVTEQAARTSVTATQRMAQARSNLGIRSEKEIQREIQRTIASYNRLKQSGTASAREIARAQEAARNRVRELNAEMGRTSTGQRLMNAGRNIAGVAAGVTAGAMVLREPVRKSMSYDRELAMVANTAFSDRDVEGRIEGKKELHQAVKNAVATGGGTKEEALSALNALLASGMDSGAAINLLPTLQKGAVATGASAEDLAAITVSALQNGIAQSDIGKALDMAVAAGQAGQFELQDMAKWLPQQMASASSIGLKGLAGFETLLVANQQSRVTAGTTDEAGNNLVNLLGKITASATQDRVEKLEYKDKNGKVRSINYMKSMEAYKAQGKNSLEAFMAIMDKVIEGNDTYKALQQKLKNTKNKDEQRALLEEMSKLAEGSAIGEVISDKQALMALIAIRNNQQLGEEVKKALANSDGAVETSHKVIAATNDYKTEDTKAMAEFGQMEGLEGFNNALGEAAQTLSNYMKAYPELTSTIAGVGTGIAALGAAAATAAASVRILGNGGGGGLGDMLGSGRGGGAAAGGARSAGGKFGGLLSFGSRALGLLGAVTMLSGDENPETKKKKWANDNLTEEQKAAHTYQHNKAVLRQYDEGQWFTRLMMTDSSLKKTRQDVADYEAKHPTQQAANSQKPNYGGVAQVASQVQLLSAAQTATKGQVEAANQVLMNYQADFNAFGQVISDGLQAGLAAQSHTLDNHITVELDGAVIAQKVSQYQFNFMKRG